MNTITESIWKLGRSCPTKVTHLRDGLPRRDDAAAFVQWMNAETGRVSALARHFFPEAKAIPEGDDGVAFTHATLLSGCPVAGARFSAGGASCRVDFAAREGSVIRLYQVVAKPVDLPYFQLTREFTEPNGRIRREWFPTIELMAFRVWMVQQLWPAHRVIPLLIAPVKGAVGRVDRLHSLFEETPSGWRTTQPAAAVEATHLVRQFAIASECAPLVAGVGDKVAQLVRVLENPPPPQLSYACKKCEFHTPGSGFDRCWGALKDVSPSAWAMPWLYFIQEEGGPVFNRLARNGTISLWDIPRGLIRGRYAARQRLFLDCTARQREIIRPGLAAELDRLQYPLHFLDIEAFRSVLPLSTGSRGSEVTFFQFSVHTIASPGAEPTHREFLDSEPGCPNDRFLAALRDVLGDSGSCLVWSNFEESSFRNLRDDLLRSDNYGEDGRWLDQLILSGRLVDQYQLCLDHYIHPKMGGKASIKSVLPAVWSEDTPAKRQKPFDAYPQDLDPYAALKESGCVSDGVAAMAGYLAMLSRGGPDREALRQELLRYCAVDTAAEVVIYLHWQHLLRKKSGLAPTATPSPSARDAVQDGPRLTEKGIAA